MPINVRHEVDPRLLSDTAFRIGRGGAYLRERDRYDKFEQEAYNRQEDEYRRQWEQYQEEDRRRQQERSNQFSESNELRNRYESDRTFNEPSYTDRQQAQQFDQVRDDQQAHRENELDWKQQQQLQRAQSFRKTEEAKYNGKWVFSAAQQQRQSQLLQEINGLRNDPSIEDWQREDEINNRYKEYHEIISQPEKFEPNQTPPLEQMAQEELHPEYDDSGRLIGKWSKSPKGDWKLHTFKADTTKDKDADKDKDAEKELVAALKEASLEVVGERVTGDDKEALIQERARKILARKDELKASMGAKQEALAYMQGGASPEQPGIAQADPGAQQNEQARQSALDQYQLQIEQLVRENRIAEAKQIAAQVKALQNGGS